MDPIKKQKFSSNSQEDENVLTGLPPLLHLTRGQETSIMVSTLEHIISGSIGGGTLRDATLSSSGTEIVASTATKGEKKRELRQMLEGKWVAEIQGPRRAKSCDRAAVEFCGDFETTQEPSKSCNKSVEELQEAKAEANASFPLFDCQLDQG